MPTESADRKVAKRRTSVKADPSRGEPRCLSGAGGPQIAAGVQISTCMGSRGDQQSALTRPVHLNTLSQNRKTCFK
jgi:hypothetical protein